MAFFWALSLLVAGLAAIWDARTGHIPNWIPGVGFLVGLGAHGVGGALAGGPLSGLLEVGYSLLGTVLCAFVPWVLYVKGGGGGGDVKLLGALGAILHPMGGLEAELYGFVAAALLAPAKLAYDGVLLRTLRNTLNLMLNPLRSKSRRQEIPGELMTWYRMGPPIFLGVAAFIAMRWAGG